MRKRSDSQLLLLYMSWKIFYKITAFVASWLYLKNAEEKKQFWKINVNVHGMEFYRKKIYVHFRSLIWQREGKKSRNSKLMQKRKSDSVKSFLLNYFLFLHLSIQKFSPFTVLSWENLILKKVKVVLKIEVIYFDIGLFPWISFPLLSNATGNFVNLFTKDWNGACLIWWISDSSARFSIYRNLVFFHSDIVWKGPNCVIELCGFSTEFLQYVRLM